MGFLENLKIRNTIAGGLGKEYAKETSIPQGVPMSMAVIALLMRAWIVQMKEMSVNPRLLADDLQLVGTGAKHSEKFQRASDKTHMHLEDLGARIAPDKCNAFSSNEAARRWLRKHRWRRLGKKVKVINDCRDLGAHFNAVAGRKVGTTTSERMRQTARSAGRLEKHKAPYDQKAKIIRSKKLPMGLFGGEVAPENVKDGIG